MTAFSIRSMTPDDLSACADLMANAPLWRRYGVTSASARARLADALAGPGMLFVAVDDDALLGFVWCVRRGAFARSGYIPLIGVQAGETGRGVGAALLERAEAWLGESSPDVFLTVSDFNTAAQRFYQRHGYAQVGALPDYVIDGVTELIYWKRLSIGANEDRAGRAGRRPGD
jgi:ribosomal protein S18 acetylase RimI-like enzyme